jgi:hypothetical protein
MTIREKIAMMGVLLIAGGIAWSVSCTPDNEPEPLDLTFSQRFEGENIRLGSEGQVSGTFDGAIYMSVEEGEFTGFIITMSDGFYFHGIPMGEGARANVSGTVERFGEYCFEAAIVTDLPLEAYVIGCQNMPDIDLVVQSGSEIECSVLYAVDPIDEYFEGSF